MLNNKASQSSFGINFKSKATVITAVKIIITLGILYYLITFIEYEEILNALKNADIIALSFAAVLVLLNVFLQYSKWRLTCKEVLGIEDNSKIIRSLFYGFSAGIVTPVRIGEYFGRGIEFRDNSLIQVTVATLVDKFFSLLVVAFIGSISSLLFIYLQFNVSVYIVISLFILIFSFFYLFLILLLSERFWDSILFAKLNSSKRIKLFLEKLKIFKSLNKEYFYKMLFLSILFHSCILIQYTLLIIAFSHHYDILNYIWAGNLVMFIKTIIPTISFGDLGVREGASVYFIKHFGEISSVGFNASIFLFIINLLIPAIFGAGMFLRKNDY